MYASNFFSLFSVDAQLSGAYRVRDEHGTPTATYRGFDVTMPCGDMFDVSRGGVKVGNGFNNGVTLVMTMRDGRLLRGCALDGLLDMVA